MATYRGLDGSLQFNAQAVANVKNWTVNVAQDLIDASKMGDGWKVNVGGQGSWSGSCLVNFDYGDTNGQKAMVDKIIATIPSAAGTAAQFRASATKYIAGDIVIVGVQIVAQLSDVLQATINFVGTGNPSISWS